MSARPFATRAAMLACAVAAFSSSVKAGPAQAQAAAGDVTSAVSIDAGLAARAEALKRQAALRAPQPAAVTETPPPPITDSDRSKPGFEGKPLTYSVDLSAMFEGGKTNWDGGLPGGMDASLVYKVDRTTRLGAYYFQASGDQLGSDDEIPIVFQGTTKPIGYINGLSQRVDTTTHLRFQVYSFQQMFFISGNHNPLILAPLYASIKSGIAGTNDLGTIFANNHVLPNVHERSYELEGLNLVIPLFYGEKYLITYSGAGVRNVNTNGANITNHLQYQQTGFVQYQPDQSLTLFAQLEKVITYFPTDVYPYHSPTFQYGASKVIKAPFWIEAEVASGGPSNPNYTNIGRVGVVDLTVPCARTAAGGSPSLSCVALAANGVAIPVAGAAKYTTFTVMFGFGANPLVRPF